MTGKPKSFEEMTPDERLRYVEELAATREVLLEPGYSTLRRRGRKRRKAAFSPELWLLLLVGLIAAGVGFWTYDRASGDLIRFQDNVSLVEEQDPWLVRVIGGFMEQVYHTANPDEAVQYERQIEKTARVFEDYRRYGIILMGTGGVLCVTAIVLLAVRGD